MNERYQEVLEQYEVETLSVRKGRGAWICETDKGLKLLREYKGTVRRLEFEDQVLECLDTRGSLRADQYVRNQEGALLSKAGDGTGFLTGNVISGTAMRSVRGFPGLPCSMASCVRSL